jgi:hypothetical protein
VIPENIMSVDLELPEIRTWARAELSGYTDSEVDRIICEWSSADSTRRELHWLNKRSAGEDHVSRQHEHQRDPIPC